MSHLNTESSGALSTHTILLVANGTAFELCHFNYDYFQITYSYPLGVIPRLYKASLANSLNQLARLTPSSAATASNCSFNAGSIRILNCGD